MLTVINPAIRWVRPIIRTLTPVGSSNRLTSFTGPAARRYTYDASGNTLTTSSGYAFSYDARERMTHITAGSVNQYGINGLGQRLTKAGTGYTGTLRFVYGEDGKLLGEYDNAGTLLTEHVCLQDTPIAAIKTAGAYVVQADNLNTPGAILGAANALVWKWDSDAFGTTAANENPSALGAFNYNLRFPGQYYDKESTFHYNYFRDYNPKTGRYIESDPIGLKGGINTYGYVGGNPVTYSDPKGEIAIAAVPIAMAVVAIAAAIHGVQGTQDAINSSNSNGGPMLSNGLPPGYWPGPNGAEEWGRRNNVDPSDARGRFHGIKQGRDRTRGMSRQSGA